MTLRGLAHSLTVAINPDVIGSILVSTGYATDGAGVRTPSYTRTDGVALQVQALSSGDLKHVDSLNIQGNLRTVLLDGSLAAVQRLNQKGGDLLHFLSSYWLVETVVEPWDTAGWCRVVVSQQVSGPDQGELP